MPNGVCSVKISWYYTLSFKNADVRSNFKPTQNVGEAQLLYPRCNINVSQIEINGQYSPTNSNRPVNCQIFSVPAIELNNGAKNERNKNSTTRIDSHSEDWMNAPSPLSLHADNKYNE